MSVIEFVSQPWHWSVTGLGIALVVFLLMYSGERFGISVSFDTVCSMSGAGKWIDYFKVDWKRKMWLLVFVLGSALGGYLGVTVFQSPGPVHVTDQTVQSLAALGVQVPQTKAEGMGFLPAEIFNFKNLLTLKGFIMMVIGGFMIGFGTRYAGGCTSGHAINGLAHLRLSSLIATIGFFLGGLIMTHFLFPLIFSL